MKHLLAAVHQIDRRQWLRALGEIWTACDDLWAFYDPLKRLLGTHGPIPDMMTREEAERFDVLPSRLVIFRGGWKGVPDCAWTLEPYAAQAFPLVAKRHTLHQRDGRNVPVFFSAFIDKANVLAVKLNSEDLELIAFPQRPHAKRLVHVAHDDQVNPRRVRMRTS